MSKKTTYLFGVLASLIIGSFLHFSLCAHTDEITKPAVITKGQKQDNNSIPFMFDDGYTVIQSNDNFRFMTSGHVLMQPISDNLLSCVNQMILRLRERKPQTLTITGLYREDEDNLSNFDNLGDARANEIKNFLVNQGLPKNQIVISNKKIEKRQDGKDVLTSYYTLKVETSNELLLKLEEVKSKIIEDPVLINFEAKMPNAVLSPDQKNKLKSLAILLNKSKNAQCMIVGHTDSIEHKRHPRILGKSRAEFTKRALMKYKVNPEKIKITSHCPSRPIALNNTGEGRALNRRTEVIIN